MQHADINFTSVIYLFIFLLAFKNVLADPASDEEIKSSDAKVGILQFDDIIAGIILPANKKPLDNCPAQCSPEWIGDGWCDTDCASEGCEKDGGDCQGWCAADCLASWIGDGFCDIDCFRPECQYDGGDCDKKYSHEELQIPLPKHAAFDYSKCPPSCNPKKIHDGRCNDECNILQCNFDGGDCRHQCGAECANVWLGDGECDLGCNTENCGYDKGDCDICQEGCESGMIGNGICDPQCDNEACHHDMGDCYGVCWSADIVDYYSEPFFFPHCRLEWRGDGFCDCFCLTKGCDYDFGDCDNTDCSNEFALLDDLNKRMNTSSPEFPTKEGQVKRRAQQKRYSNRKPLLYN